MSALLRFALLVLVVTLSPSPTQATNKYPIILVNGFSGWGRDELLGFRYWGGIQGDFQNELTAQGYTVYTAAVGPFASTTGTVPVSSTRSSKAGKCISWGTVWAARPSECSLNCWRTARPVLRLGRTHRPTVVQGRKELGALYHDHLHAQPRHHLGQRLLHYWRLSQGPTGGCAECRGNPRDSAKMVYDAKLDQWGITTKQSGESIQAYLDRVFSSRIFDPSFKDVCLWSLSTSGAKEEATWVKTLSDVYYYSYTTVDTFDTRDLLLRKISLPNLLTMLLPLDPLAVFLGGRYAPDKLKLSTDWQPNDGVVNTFSMGSDGVGAAVTFAGASQLGKWNKMPLLNRLDHLAVVGITLHTQVLDLYEGHAALLYALPASSSSRRLADAPAAVAKLDTAIVELTAATTSVETKSDLESLCQSPKNSYAQSYCTKMLEAAPRVVYEDRRQRLRWKTVELCSPCVGLKYAVVSHATNTYPVVGTALVAGVETNCSFQVLGRYPRSIQEELEALGYTVYTASIDHLRFGKNYTGLYPEWGETNSEGSVNKIHLIGHSMGGQTIRMLAQMLEKGTTGAPVEETTYTSPLFEGDTTGSTPSRLFQRQTRARRWLMVSRKSATDQGPAGVDHQVLGIFGDSVDLLYDAQLDQWGITAKQDDETLQEYFDRVLQ
ncbi:Alpha/Beta hydrolase fold [Phytophthora cactorum]|nr:Alpha/Beta hydrolase fold [Phytophthora cactorum]